MPNATLDPSNYTKEDLTSLPPDGYIMVRPLPYGMVLERRQKATKMYMEATGKNQKQAEREVNRFEIDTMNTWATLYDFAYCIGEHNVEDANGTKLDLSQAMTLNYLDPKVGAEIEKIVASYNEPEDEEDFTPPALTSTQTESNTSQPTEPTAA